MDFLGLLAGDAAAVCTTLLPPLCDGTRLTLTATLVPILASAYPPQRRRSVIFRAFSVSASALTCTSLPLANVRVEARRRDDGRSGAEIDIGDPNEEEEADVAEIVDLRTPEYRFEFRVDELGEEGECLLCSDRWRACAGRR